MKYTVTIKYKKLPWYMVSGIEATCDFEAKEIAIKQSRIECGYAEYKKITVEKERQNEF